jgi:hypothetical protein
VAGAVYNTNHQVFGIAVDPATGSVFTTSFAECGAAALLTDGCWGNARIDRFSYDVNTLTHEGAALLLQGPVRFGEPVVDTSGTEVVFPMVNQGPGSLDIVTATLGTEDTSAVLVSACDGLTLAEGESCDLTISADSAEELEYIPFDVETGVGTLSADLTSDEEVGTPVVGGPAWDVADDFDLPRCAVEGWGIANQVGACAPTALAISRDGTRVFVNDDRHDLGFVLSLESDGSVAFLSESEDGMNMQGVAVNGDGTAVYNGGTSYSIDADMLVEETYYGGGNATEVFEVGGVEMLATTIENRDLAIFDLTSPHEPVLIDEVSPADGRARYQHHSADGTRFVTIDHADLVVYAFDGAELTEQFSSEIPVELDEELCEECEYEGFNRVVQVSADGTQAMTGVFVNAWDEEARSVVPFFGQVRSFDVDGTTGEATEVDSLDLPGMTRALLIVPIPE